MAGFMVGLIVILAAALAPPHVADAFRRARDSQNTNAEGYDPKARAALTQWEVSFRWYECMKRWFEKNGNRLDTSTRGECQRLLDFAVPCIEHMKKPIKTILRSTHNRGFYRSLQAAFSPTLKSAYEGLEIELKALNDLKSRMDSIARTLGASQTYVSSTESDTRVDTVMWWIPPSIVNSSSAPSDSVGRQSSIVPPKDGPAEQSSPPSSNHALSPPGAEVPFIGRLSDTLQIAQTASGKDTLSRPEQIGLASGAMGAVAANATVAAVNARIASQNLKLAQKDEQRKINDEERKAKDEARKAELHPLQRRKAEVEAATAESEAGKPDPAGTGSSSRPGNDVDQNAQHHHNEGTLPIESPQDMSDRNSQGHLLERLSTIELELHRLLAAFDQNLQDHCQFCHHMHPSSSNGDVEDTEHHEPESDDNRPGPSGSAAVSWKDPVPGPRSAVERNEILRTGHGLSRNDLEVSDSGVVMDEDNTLDGHKSYGRAEGDRSVSVLPGFEEEIPEPDAEPYCANQEADVLSGLGLTYGARFQNREATHDGFSEVLERQNPTFVPYVSTSDKIRSTLFGWATSLLAGHSSQKQGAAQAPMERTSFDRSQWTDVSSSMSGQRMLTWNEYGEFIPLEDLART